MTADSRMQLDPGTLLGTGVGLLSAALYAVSVVMYRSQKKGMRTLQISAVRMWISVPVTGLLLLTPLGSGSLFVSQEVLFFLLVSAITGSTLGDTLYLLSQARIGVSYAFPIAMSYPILTYLLTYVFLGDDWTLLSFVGAIMAVAGVIVLTNQQSVDEGDAAKRRHIDVIGVSMAVLCVVFYAVGITALELGFNAAADLNPVTANFIRLLIGSVVLVPIFLFDLKTGKPRPTKHSIYVASAAGVIGMALSSLLYVAAVKIVGAAMTSVFETSAPLFAVPLAIRFLKEKLTLVGAAAIMTTILGVTLVILGR